MESNTLYVGNLTYSVNEEQLKELFSRYGTVNDVRVIERKGFGFVEMSSPEEAEDAKEALNNTVFEGRTLKIVGPASETSDFAGIEHLLANSNLNLYFERTEPGNSALLKISLIW